MLQVFPYNNPAETYQYHSLPFCRTRTRDGERDGQRERQRLGELLVGDRKVGFSYNKAFFFCFARFVVFLSSGVGVRAGWTGVGCDVVGSAATGFAALR